MANAALALILTPVTERKGRNMFTPSEHCSFWPYLICVTSVVAPSAGSNGMLRNQAYSMFLGFFSFIFLVIKRCRLNKTADKISQ